MLDPFAQDPAFRDVTWLVLDFEGTTPTGCPAEPIEVGAVLLRLDGVELVETGRYEALMRPPEHAPVTAFGTRQNGITAAMVAGRPTADTVLADFDATLTANRYITVAHHASTEAGILARYAHACPTLAAAPVLDTVRLARHAYPDLGCHALDALLDHLAIPSPPDRHRALPDAIVTAALFIRLLADGARSRQWSRLTHLRQLAGLPAPSTTTSQAALF